ERGFKALKTNVLLFDDKGGRLVAPGMIGAGAGHPELNLAEDVLAALIDQLAALREGAGKGVRLLLDLNFNYKPEGLRRIAKAVLMSERVNSSSPSSTCSQSNQEISLSWQ